MIDIAVGTQNPVKQAAVQEAFGEAFGDVNIIGIEADSGIAAMPMTDEESIRGATNRAIAALEAAPTATYGVGLEGNVAETAGRMFLRGWVVIIERSAPEQTGLGHSGGVELPETIAQRVRNGEELGPLVQELFGHAGVDLRATIGTNGVLTRGLYDRADEFVDATRCALARFVMPRLYSD